MSSFPLLRLPHLASEQVFKSMAIAELVELSFCSAACKDIVQRQRFRSLKTEITIGSFLAIQLRIGRKTFFEWSFRKTYCPRGTTSKRVIHGTEILVKQREYGFSTGGRPGPKIKLVFNYLQELFNLPISQFSYDDYSRVSIFPKTLGITKCDSISFSSSESPVDNEEMKYILEKMEPAKKLYFNFGDHLDCLKSVKFTNDEICFWQSPWLTRDQFLSLSCARIRLNYTNLTVEDVMDFVLQWFYSSNTGLEKLDIICTGYPVTVDWSRFQAVPWDPSVRGQYYDTFKHMDFSSGLDITRSDGLLATIKQSSNRFDFVVWHNRFPT